MKALLLSLASAIAIPLIAQANIGDTLEQSIARYGQPTGHQEHFYDWRNNSWWIIEWLDPETGKTEYIMYRHTSDRLASKRLICY